MKNERTTDFNTDPEMDRRIANEPKTHIPGWGHDADPENDPTYPMKHWNGADHERLNYQRPQQQRVDLEILHSNERPNVTAVFGTTVPPKGLSGKLRRYAFRHSETTYAHWLPLVLADRVAVFEGLWDDLKLGIVPNLLEEKGWQAEWKYNRKGLLQKAALGVAITSAVLIWMSLRRKED